MSKKPEDQQRRILGIDYGTRRIGISLSDPLQIIAQPYETIENGPRTLLCICQMIASEDVELVVVGMPLNLKGEKGQKAKEVERFVKELANVTTTDVMVWDERFTTSMAHQTLLDMGTKREERRNNKGRVDAMAAALLLQSFLDSRKRSLSC